MMLRMGLIITIKAETVVVGTGPGSAAILREFAGAADRVRKARKKSHE